MADIRIFKKEKEKRDEIPERKPAGEARIGEGRADTGNGSARTGAIQEKIKRYRLSNLYRILLVLAVLGAMAALVLFQYNRHVYTEYEVVSSQERPVVDGAVDMRLGNCLLTYSKDGAHCTDQKGNVLWNQTFEMQDILISVSGATVAMGDYNGRSIYVMDTTGTLGEITTNLPIRSLAVSGTGRVVAILADSDVTWVNTYGVDGTLIFEGKASMSESGYPAAAALSPGGTLLAVSYIYLDAGIQKTNLAFYNLGTVGDNYNDRLVSAYTYSDVVIPYIRFMNDSTVAAVGDNQIIFFTGSQKPVLEASYLYSQEVQSVYGSDRYIGLVFASDQTGYQNKMDLYSVGADMLGTQYFELDYTDVFFGKDVITAYNESECVVKKIDGTEKFRGAFDTRVRCMLEAKGAYRYVLVREGAMDTVQLK